MALITHVMKCGRNFRLGVIMTENNKVIVYPNHMNGETVRGYLETYVGIKKPKYINYLKRLNSIWVMFDTTQQTFLLSKYFAEIVDKFDEDDKEHYLKQLKSKSSKKVNLKDLCKSRKDNIEQS
jgi:hypothetical protein